MFLKILLISLLILSIHSYGLVKISLITPQGQITKVIRHKQQTSKVLPFDMEFLRQTMMYDLMNALNKQVMQERCYNGIQQNGVCICRRGWAGDDCSIHVHEVQNDSLQLLFHQVQFFMLKEPINQINLNWNTNKVFLVNETTGSEISEISENNRFIVYDNKDSSKDRKLIKIVGRIGTLVQFKNSQYKLLDYIYLIGIVPAIIASIIYLIKKLRHRRKSIKMNQYIKIHKTINHEQCSICLMNQPINEKVQLECHHSFHSGCISDWISTNSSCPYCRSELTFVDE